MTILVAVKKNGRVFLGADRITTFGQEYFTDLVNGGKIIKLKHAYLATSGYTLLDNILEHLHANNHKIMDNKFASRADVFQFMLELYTELKKGYTLTDTGKDTYAGIYNVFLVVTDSAIYGISNNLTVTEYPSYVAKGAGSDYSLGCMYALYDTVDDARELCRLALEAACHFCIYCREPLDIIEVKASDFGRPGRPYKDHGAQLHTVPLRKGAGDVIHYKNGNGTAKKAPKPKASATTKTSAASKAKTKTRKSK
jgi:ATP-dependent protease HslVU (ClpYQ) peptidase subunit